MPDMNGRVKHVGLRVLCIDDHPEVLEVEKSILEHWGYEVLVASNGDDGIRLAKGCKVDLVLLDYEMLRMMGTEVARRLREMHPNPPIIIFSASELPEEAATVADCCVSKTKMGEALVQEVNRLLGTRARASERSHFQRKPSKTASPAAARSSLVESHPLQTGGIQSSLYLGCEHGSSSPQALVAGGRPRHR